MPTFYLWVMEVFWSYLGSSYPPAAQQSSHILHRTGKPLSLLFPDTLTPQSLIILASCLPPHAIPPKRCWPQVAPFFLPGYALSRAPYDPITLSPASASYLSCPQSTAVIWRNIFKDRAADIPHILEDLATRYSPDQILPKIIPDIWHSPADFQIEE